jgi:acyl-CoA synthetase (AMP-forming)/AMP-acid ligase II
MAGFRSCHRDEEEVSAMPCRIWRGDHIDVPSQATIVGLIAEVAARAPQRPALLDSISGRTVTYGALMEMVWRMAAGLRARGGGAGTCLAVHAGNSPEWVVAALGIMAAGGAATGASPLMKVDELVRQLRITKTRFLVTAPPLHQVAQEAAAGTGGIEVIVTGGPTDGATSLDAVLASASAALPSVPAPDATAMLPLSSGTTGWPKAVELTHRSLSHAALQVHAALGWCADDTVLAVAPFFHILGSAVVMGGGLTIGAKLVTMPRYDFETMLAAIERHQVSVLVVPPPVMKALADHPSVDKHDLSRVRLICCGGAHVPAHVEDRVSRRLKATVIQGYGLTETSANVSINPPAAPRSGTCGKLFPLVEACIVEPERAVDQSPGEAGEIWIRGPHLMKGFFGDADATKAMLAADGWLRTGDIGFFDADGYLHLTDRLKELIKVNAAQVSPTELEALIATHPAVSDVAVAGRTNDQTGEIPVAYVVRRAPLEANELMIWVAARVGPHKKVRAVEFINEVPRSPAGKILRRALKALPTGR